jgi:hypothetical protein
VPLATFEPADDFYFELDDVPVPLASFPDEVETLELVDTPVPLSAMPNTGVADVGTVFTSGLFIATLIAAVTSHSIRKMVKNQQTQ